MECRGPCIGRTAVGGGISLACVIGMVVGSIIGGVLCHVVQKCSHGLCVWRLDLWKWA